MKKNLVYVGLVCALLLTGASTTNGVAQAACGSTVKAAAEKGAVCKYYQKLDKADQKKVDVTYTTTKVGSKYDVNAKIENKSAKTVKLNLGDICIYNKDGNKIKSAKTNTVTVKPKGSCTVNKLFTGVSKETLKSKNDCIIYMNPEHKLGSYDFKL
ncbi:hypothetical protein [Companilactobacillus furfuricola]|uniref:hypothetical protein n=1 Tax=Companilactobacillus furfuricola TaxID=1462575 RepID=UPI000F79D4BC|nr:hypothetical protein [Companilactobacillus furfuricola]